MKNLKAAAQELNEVMGLTPAIETKVGTTKVDLKANLLKAAEFIQPADEISDETIETLKSIGWSGPEKAEKKDKKSKKDKKEEPIAEGEEKSEKKGKKDKKDKKDKKAKKEEPIAEAEEVKKPKVTRNPKYSKNQAMFDAIKSAGKKGISKKDLYQATDDFYVENGGQSNLSGSKANVDISLPCLLIFGAVEVKDDKITLA